MSVVQGRREAEREEPSDQQQGEDTHHQERQSRRQWPVLLLRQERSWTCVQQQQLHTQNYRCVFCDIALIDCLVDPFMLPLLP